MCGGFHSQLDDVWVSEQFEILDFPFDLPDDIEAADLLSVQDLYRHFMACQLMFTDCTMREHRREAEAAHRTRNTEHRQAKKKLSGYRNGVSGHTEQTQFCIPV